MRLTLILLGTAIVWLGLVVWLARRLADLSSDRPDTWDGKE